MLTATVASSPNVQLNGYDFATIYNEVDYVHLLPLDYWNLDLLPAEISHKTPLFCDPRKCQLTDGWCVERALEKLLDQSMETAKITLGSYWNDIWFEQKLAFRFKTKHVRSNLFENS